MITLSIALAFSLVGVPFFFLGVYDLKGRRPIESGVNFIVSIACFLLAAIFYFGYLSAQ